MPLPAVSSQLAVARSDLLCELKKPHDSVISANQSSSAASSLIRTKTFHTLLLHYSCVFLFKSELHPCLCSGRESVCLQVSSEFVSPLCSGPLRWSSPPHTDSHRGCRTPASPGGKGRDTLT